MRLFGGLVGICAAAASATAQPRQVAVAADPAFAVEAAILAGQPKQALAAFDALVDARAGVRSTLAPDPELNGLYGRMHLAFGTPSVGLAYLERADDPSVPPARRAEALLALAAARLAVNDHRGALEALGRVDKEALGDAGRARATLLTARATLVRDPARALSVLGDSAGWDADMARAQARLLLGDVAGARVAADRAWVAAADTPAPAEAVGRVALLRAALAHAEGRGDRETGMLTTANGAGRVIRPTVSSTLPLCGRNGLRPDDHATFVAYRDARGWTELFPVGASRPAALPPFLDALGPTPVLDAAAHDAGGTLLTVRCRTTGVGGNAAPFRADPWAARLAEAGLFISMDMTADGARLNEVADRYDRWETRLGRDNPALLGVAIDLSLGLANRAMTGQVEPARVLEAQQRVRTLATALGRTDGMMPTDADIAALKAVAEARTPELQARLAGEQIERVVGRVPPDLAFAIAEEWFTSIPEPAAADRLRIADRLLARLPKDTTDLRVRAAGLRRAEALRDLDRVAEARAAVVALGVPTNACEAADKQPTVEKSGVSSEDYNEDLLMAGIEGVALFELDLDRTGAIRGERLILSSPSGLFDAPSRASLARTVFTPAVRGKAASACQSHDYRIIWRVEDEKREIFPDLTVSPDLSSS